MAGAAVSALVLAATAAQATPGASGPARWIVFSAHPDGSGAAQLFRVQTTGEGLEQLTRGRLPATAPAFSPDGKQIVFSRLGSGIFRINLDGSGLHKLSSNARDSYPVWSRDGKQIAFVRPYRADWRLYVMSASGAAKRRLPHAPPAGRPTWTANGKSIFIPAAGDLVRVDAASGKVQKYYGLSLDTQTSQTATLSPDARRIAYVGPRVSTGPEDCGDGPCPQYGLYLASVPAPHRARRIVNDTGPAGWSPDGKTLVFAARGVLTLRDLAGGRRTTIETGEHVATGDAPPAWQPR